MTICVICKKYIKPNDDPYVSGKLYCLCGLSVETNIDINNENANDSIDNIDNIDNIFNKTIQSMIFGDSVIDDIANSLKMFEKNLLEDLEEKKKKIHYGTLYVTLEELYKGCSKIYVFNDKKYDIEIKPGYKQGTKFTYTDQVFKNTTKINKTSSYDVVITLKQTFNKNFTRDGDNVIYNRNVSKLNKNKKYKISFDYLDGDIINFVLDKTLFDIGVFLILDRGFINRKTNTRGHLIIKLIG
jgi:hypothetical protein